MHGPATVGWLLTALCALTGASCLLRAWGACGVQRTAAGSEALMSIGMAVMAVPASAVRSAPPAAFAVFFAVAAAVELALLSTRRGAGRAAHHHLHHTAGALAMVYMSLAMTSGGPSAGHAAHGGPHQAAATGVPLLTGLLLAYFTVYVLAAGVRLLPAAAPAGTPATAPGAAQIPATGPPARPARLLGDVPEFGLGCRLAMAVCMLAMLATM